MRGLGQQARVTVKRPVSNTFHLAPIRFLNHPPGCSALLMVTRPRVLPLPSLITARFLGLGRGTLPAPSYRTMRGEDSRRGSFRPDRDRMDSCNSPAPIAGISNFRRSRWEFWVGGLCVKRIFPAVWCGVYIQQWFPTSRKCFLGGY